MSDVISGVPRELLGRLCSGYPSRDRADARDQLRALLTAQPQASADDSRKLSDLGNELHNLSCHVVHVNEGWAEQIGKIACELWKWPQASAAQSAPDAAELYNRGFDDGRLQGVKEGLERAAQSAPAGEREAVPAEKQHPSMSLYPDAKEYAAACGEVAGWNACRKAVLAAWQRTLAAGVPEGWRPIETAPKDNLRPIWIAQFDRDGALVDIDSNAIWQSEQESWEIPQTYYFWASDHGRVEEPTHWAYMGAAPAQPAAQREWPDDEIVAAWKWCEENGGTPAEFLSHSLLVKRSRVLGRPLTWREAIELTAITTNMPDEERDKLLAIDDEPDAAAQDQGEVQRLRELPPLGESLRSILGRPNFACAGIAKHLRGMGYAIPQKAEEEQAATIHWLVNLYLKHGEDWATHANAALAASTGQEVKP